LQRLKKLLNDPNADEEEVERISKLISQATVCSIEPEPGQKSSPRQTLKFKKRQKEKMTCLFLDFPLFSSFFRS
jgi:hypothetical protein